MKRRAAHTLAFVAALWSACSSHEDASQESAGGRAPPPPPSTPVSLAKEEPKAVEPEAPEPMPRADNAALGDEEARVAAAVVELERKPSDNAPSGTLGPAGGFDDAPALTVKPVERPVLKKDSGATGYAYRTAEPPAGEGVEVDEQSPSKVLDLVDKRSRDDDEDLSRFARRDGAMKLVTPADDPDRFDRPQTVLPRVFYFENTYLGGSAAYAERLRRLESALAEGDRHYRQARAEEQPFDPPQSDGLAVSASLDVTHLERAQRVFLQVGLRGSDRYGWRRPPLDVALVVDPSALAQHPGAATRFVIELLRKLGTADRLAIVVARPTPERFLEVSRTPNAQQHLARRIDDLEAPGAGPLDEAMRLAGELLVDASEDEAIVPGSKTVFVLTGSSDESQVARATAAAHDLTVEGAVTSIFALGETASPWWQVANAGYGNFHRVDQASLDEALDEELSSLARVVARLVRVNIRLGKDAQAIRVLGTRVLDEAEVEAVKAREVATDINLSKSLGIASDRGEDDDGIQTVIPYFYGDDSHVVLVELWVEHPGLVADVTVRYKDMVNLDNATARTSVKLGARPQAATREQTLIAQNVRGALLAESFQRASNEVRRGDASSALRTLEAARAMANDTNPFDRQAVEGLKDMVERGTWQANPAERSTLEESLLISGQRRVGDTDQH